MRFEVPQFIDIEDKIFGPLTWKQFLYVGGGVGMAVVMFFTMPFLVFILIGVPIGALAGALAFYPINNRPFSYFLEAIFTYFTGQNLYLWKRKTSALHKQDTTSVHQTTAPVVTQSRPKPKKDISSLARKLEMQALQKTE